MIVWFRADLRLADNPALHAAAETRRPIVPLFIWCPEEEGDWPPGAASRWWLHHSLSKLESGLRSLGVPLLFRRGPAAATLEQLCRETGAASIYYNRRYEPAILARDADVERRLSAQGIETLSYNAGLLHEPWAIKNKAGRPFQVFTPFWRTCLAQGEPAGPLPAPVRLRPLHRRLASLPLDSLQLLPVPDWAEGLRQEWRPGEAGAQDRLQEFALRPPSRYEAERDRPAMEGTSRLSPHLHFGEVSPRQIWHTCKAAHPGGRNWVQWQFLTELGWREFAHHLLFHFPETPKAPLRPEFRNFPWREDPGNFDAWRRGRTGCPIVDAGMRQLWRTGWMHNRVRMIVASYLVKNLLIPWQMGAEWFWDTLVDADLANNTLGWQWTAGCGADAAPYFRIFNPVAQGDKFDPDGTYVKRWIPELAPVPSRHVHSLGAHSGAPSVRGNYPEPLVSLFASRARALEAYSKMKNHGARGKSG